MHLISIKEVTLRVAKLISLNLYPDEVDLLDKLVSHVKSNSFTPHKINRSTVIRDLVLAKAREIETAKTGGDNVRGSSAR